MLCGPEGVVLLVSVECCVGGVRVRCGAVASASELLLRGVAYGLLGLCINVCSGLVDEAAPKRVA